MSSYCLGKRPDRLGKRMDLRDGIPEDPAEAARMEALKLAHAEREAVKRERGLPSTNGAPIPLPLPDGPVQSGRGVRFGAEDRELLRRLVVEHPDEPRDLIIGRFRVETGRTMSRATAWSILKGLPSPPAAPVPDEPVKAEVPAKPDPPPPRFGTKAWKEWKLAKAEAIPQPEPFASEPADIYSVMREVDAALSRLDARARARVLEWFRSEVETEGVDDAKRAGNPR